MLPKFIIGGLTLAALFAAPSLASAQPVNTISWGDWYTSNSTVFKTPDGVHFGTYGDAGNIGGTLRYTGANGLKLKDVTRFSYTFNYKQLGNVAGAAPYARIFTDADGDGKFDNSLDNSIILDPSSCGGAVPDQGVNLTFGIGNSTFRYDDDPCEHGNQQTWDDIINQHGDEKVVMVSVSQGYSTGTDVSAMLKSITLNDQKFEFDAPPMNGNNGQLGVTGAPGANGSDGKDGVNGSNGANGHDGVTTVIYPQRNSSKLVGNTVRLLRVADRRGMRLIGVKATLRGRKLHVTGNMVKVDLRNRPVGHYNVAVTATYVKAGKQHIVRSAHSLTVTRA